MDCHGSVTSCQNINCRSAEDYDLWPTNAKVKSCSQNIRNVARQDVLFLVWWAKAKLDI